MKRSLEPDWKERAAVFAQRLRATGLTITQFQKKSGLSRNVIYNLSKGQKPSPEQVLSLERAFRERGVTEI